MRTDKTSDRSSGQRREGKSGVAWTREAFERSFRSEAGEMCAVTAKVACSTSGQESAKKTVCLFYLPTTDRQGGLTFEKVCQVARPARTHQGARQEMHQVNG